MISTLLSHPCTFLAFLYRDCRLQRANSNETHYHKDGFALSLVLKVRVLGNRRWPIQRFTLYEISRRIFRAGNYKDLTEPETALEKCLAPRVRNLL